MRSRERKLDTAAAAAAVPIFVEFRRRGATSKEVAVKAAPLTAGRVVEVNHYEEQMDWYFEKVHRCPHLKLRRVSRRMIPRILGMT